MTNLIKLTESNFKKTIEENEFVIVDFWATWCKPCVAFTPVFEAAAKKNKDIIFGMVDIDKDKVIADYFQVAIVPAVLFIRDRAGIHAQDGELGAPAFDEMIKWAREYDMKEVKKYMKESDKKK
ncbi:thioredoxin family protein [Methylophilaceae bacterium]|jgi:thioredoxin 1|nr:thioredoxin family protein [Methylophilaceae bacterium]